MRTPLVAALVGLGVLGASAPARADWLELGSWGHMEATVLHDLDASELVPNQIVFVGARVESFLGAVPSAHLRLDFSFGATVGDAGFYYQGALMPIGFGVGPIATNSGVTLSTGIAVSGATSTLDDAVALPVDLAVELRLGRRARLIGNVRGSFVAAADSRQNGSNISGLDELDAMLGLRIGRSVAGDEEHVSEGWFGGVAYREMLQHEYVGIVIGFSGGGGS